MVDIKVYTDGSATTAENPGGYGYVILVNEEKVTEGSGHAEKVTNNDMELEAAIQGLVAVHKIIYVDGKQVIADYNVTIFSDSQLILGWITGDFKFKQQSKMEKYRQLCALTRKMGVLTEWVKGHSGDPNNERCDFLANQARKGLQAEKARPEPIKVSKIGSKKTGVVCVWHKDKLKIVDLEHNFVEDYSRELHGPRGSMLEIREDKLR